MDLILPTPADGLLSGVIDDTPSTSSVLGSGGGGGGGGAIPVPHHAACAAISSSSDSDGEGGLYNNADDDGEDEDEANAEFPAVLADAFPAPLTEPQRRAVTRRAAAALGRHSKIATTGLIVRRGLASLERLVGRLRAEKERILLELEGGGGGTTSAPTLNESDSSSSSSEVAPPAKTARLEPPGQAATTTTTGGSSINTTTNGAATDSAAASTDTSVKAPLPTPQPPPPAPKRFGGLLRSAAFASLQKVLTTVQKEDTAIFAPVAQERERIARQTRLKLVSDDLAAQEAVLNPLLEKLERCLAAERAAEAAMLPVLELAAEMHARESRYAGSFSLRAVDGGAEGAAAAMDDNGKDEAVAATDPTKQQQQHQQEVEGSPVTSDAALPAPLPEYEVAFLPARYTPRVVDILRSQLTAALAEYEPFRARLEPILAEEEAAAREQTAARAARLLALMGDGGGDGDDNGVFGQQPQQQQYYSVALAGGSGSTTATGSSTGIRAGFGVSESDDDGDGEGSDGENSLDWAEGHPPGATRSGKTAPQVERKRGRDGDNSGNNVNITDGDGNGEEGSGGGSGAAAAADGDKQDRRLIQTALSALDDFDELF